VRRQDPVKICFSEPGFQPWNFRSTCENNFAYLVIRVRPCVETIRGNPSKTTSYATTASCTYADDEFDMVVVSVGMRKSGSGWYFNMTNELLQAAGHADARRLRHRPLLRTMIRGENCRVGRLTMGKLIRLSLVHLAGHTFAVKSHSGPARSLRAFTATGPIKVTYLYRDPRDVILSALEHGQAARKRGFDIEFKRLKTLDDSLRMVQHELVKWERWMAYPHVLKVQYEHLVADTAGELRRLADFLRLDVQEEKIRAIAAHYQKEEYAKTQEQSLIENPLHLNKGIPGRYREAMTPEARALCERHLGPYLRKMGYA